MIPPPDAASTESDSTSRPSALTIEVPEWAWNHQGEVFESTEEKMAVAVELAERNVAEGGGPFGAAVFTRDGRFIAPGVNRVVPSSIAVAHAEIVAIGLAGQVLRTWDIASIDRFELVSSTEPCAMCLGAVPWSGVEHLVCGARDSDARSVGFDEGNKPPGWVDDLVDAGIRVTRDVLRDRAVGVLKSYASGGGAIYNGGS